MGREPNLQVPHAVTWFPMAAGTIVMYAGGWRLISPAATRLSRGMSTAVIEGESHSFGCEACCCPSYPLLAGLWCRGTSDSSATTMCAGAGGSAQVPGEVGFGLCPFHILPSLSVLMHPPADVLLVGSFRRLCAEQRNLCWVINVLLDVD